MMTVAHLLRGKPIRLVTIPSYETLTKATEILARERIGALIVTAPGGDLAGILSERDIVRAIARDGTAAVMAKVSDIMTADVVCCSPDDTVDAVMTLMTAKRFRHVPVKENGKLVGMISIGDVVKAKVEDAERESADLRAYIAGT
ncbi:CBS domain-containing protein [Dongia soli]|uniref:CBS domain-containing protein n=1 Tax=Dongia soli TaxID=600628 RepID=A0ABU5E7H1_9PROT|nr:CBS domain-containing protein [Dongia soli]MDY0881493.1 CBS domain-containing protein [Dongia soli]